MGPFLSLLFLSMFSLSALAKSHYGVSPKLKYSTHSHELASDVPTGYLRFVPEETRFFEGPQKERFEQAMAMMEEVMNLEEFKNKVIGYVNSRGDRSYSKSYLWKNSSRRLSNEEVYQVIMAGDEKMRPDTLGEMNFNSWVKACSGWEQVRNFIWCSQVVGSTDPMRSYLITLNWKFYKDFETHDMVANMVHEWVHLLGFLHGESNLEEEVPYVVGDIAGEVAKDILASESYLY